MELGNITPRAILFDVYGTLMEVGPPPSDGEAQWQTLWRELMGKPARLNRLDFNIACGHEIARRHEAARAKGILHPEVYWPAIVNTVLPELATLPASKQDQFIFRQIQTGHSTRLYPGLDAILPVLRDRHLLLGIASNAQPYTIPELQAALASAKLDLDLFDPQLCVWSFQHGFSKPDPHIFRILTARLEARGISPQETLMVGDRLDNDVDPARAHGWQTWLITPAESSHPHSGTWFQFARWIL